jgi:putative DNA-invertase from lambdoid prophage Rac
LLALAMVHQVREHWRGLLPDVNGTPRGGYADLAAGAVWMRKEFELLGPFERRGRLTDEFLARPLVHSTSADTAAAVFVFARHGNRGAVFKETESGAKNDRAERKHVMALAQARKIDAILVTELSRWGRSTQDLVQTLDDLHSWKVSVFAQTGLSFDLGTAGGKLMRTIKAGLAEFERDLIRERVKSGLAATRARGVVLGRQVGQRPSDKKAKRVLAMHLDGLSYRLIAATSASPRTPSWRSSGERSLRDRDAALSFFAAYVGRALVTQRLPNTSMENTDQWSSSAHKQTWDRQCASTRTGRGALTRNVSPAGFLVLKAPSSAWP